MAKIDVAPVVTSDTTSARGKRWIVVPEKDLFDFPHPPIAINHMVFGPGKHFLDADVADWVEDRLMRKYKSDLRVMRPQQDLTSQNAMTRFGVGSRTGVFAQNPEAEMAG
jgi:hypothetical protein